MAAAPGTTLVMIGAASCGACRAMRRALAELEVGLVERLVEVDAGESPGLCAELEVFHLPALFVYRDGELHRPVEAPPRASALRAAIAAALAAAAVDPP